MNRMFLTCRHHPTQAESFLVADRPDGESFSAADKFTAGISHNRLQKWLNEHAACGGTFDHFTVSYAQQKDLDLPKPAPLANAVHATLRGQ